jgi:predicted AAA+ superfamily ATPase
LEREIITRLKSWAQKSERRPLILSGARQIGKTFTVKKFAERQYPNYYYLNFEEDEKLAVFFQSDLKVKRIIDDISTYLEQKIDLENDLIFFDEIQSCPRAITSLKYFAEELPQLAIIAAGSLLGLELSPVSFPVGKVEILHMYPMRFMEFLLAVGDIRTYELLRDFDFGKSITKPVHDKLLRRLHEYFIVGGMPKVVDTFVKNCEKENYTVYELVRQEQSRVIESVFADIAKHSGKENAMNIASTWRYMPAKIDSIYDSSNSRFRFKEVIPGKERYQDFIGVLDWLEKAHLVIRVPIVDTVATPITAHMKENIFKLYNYDIGILARLSNLSPKRILEGDYGTFKGFFVENFIVQELRYLVEHIDPIVSWRHKEQELEFICSDKAGQHLAIEVKAGQAKNYSSLKNFINIYQNKTNFVLSRDELSYDEKKFIQYLPLYFPLDFLFV